MLSPLVTLILLVTRQKRLKHGLRSSESSLVDPCIIWAWVATVPISIFTCSRPRPWRSNRGSATSIGWFTILTRAATGQEAPISSVATVFPLGLLTLVIPISPAGMGVGHVAFDRLFTAIGLTGGATVFNMFILGQMVPCLFGVIPYLLMRRSGELPTTAPSDAS